MLILTRKRGESITIRTPPRAVEITLAVVEIVGDRVRQGIEAPVDVTVNRAEVQKAIDRQGKRSDVPTAERK
jgi:carbon storage regulator